MRVSATAATPDYVADEDAALKSPDHRAAGRLQGRAGGERDRHHRRSALDGGNPNPIRLKESNLGNLVADGFLAAANRTAVADGRPVANVAFSNGGGIRTSIAGPGTPITREADVRRAAVRQPDRHRAERHAAEVQGPDGVGRRAALPESSGNGKFPQISGFKIVVSIAPGHGADADRHDDHHAGHRASSRSRSTTARRSSRTARSSPAPRTSTWPRRTSRPTTVTPTRSRAPSSPPAQVPYQQSLFDYIKHRPGRRSSPPPSTRSAAPAASRSAP